MVAQRDFLANIINVGGGDINDFSLSNTTVRTAGLSAVKETAVDIKENFRKKLIEDHEGKHILIVHFDGKSLSQFHDQIKSVKKRVAIIACSPDLTSEQVLGVPITPSNSGKDQKNVVMSVLRDWAVIPFILGLGFDTTNDNTGKKKGPVVLIEKEIGEAIGWIACPHHFYELHVKKVARHHYGDTTNPEETIYKRLKDSWNEVVEEGIDYNDLELFDWQKWNGTFLAEQANEVKNYLQMLMEKNTFPREDYKEMLILVLIWLGVKVEKFTFLYPGALSHARFMMQAIYSLKISLLSKQLNIYSSEEIEQIKAVALFVGLFHAAWYFKCPLASSAPMLHLKTISQMKKFMEYQPDVATVVLQSINLHLWYITPQSIPLALVDKSISAEKRKSIAVALADIPRPTVLPMGKPSYPDISTWPNQFWISGQLPDLSTMLGPESWLIFNKLGLTDVEWRWNGSS